MLSQAIASVRPEVFRNVEKLGVEGIVSKRADKPNPRGRTGQLAQDQICAVAVK
jgi:ATP-dependent DNA ligase